jgi:phthalate 4,5-dioxygenase
MLSYEDNEILTRSGPGTPVGDLLRRYWTPVALSEELPEPDGAPVRVRILGENLVAFRDSTGTIGLVDEACPHRGASLFFGRNEESGLRCPYHGWKFDRTGQCVDQRSELVSFADKITITSYPVHESGGIVWAYLGPADTMTPFRDFGTESLPPQMHAASKEYIDCNWVQSFDGDLDTAHISNLHQFNAIDDIPDDGSDKPGYPSTYMSMKFWRYDPKARLEVHDQWYGYRYAGIRRTPNGHSHVRISVFVMPYTAIIANVPYSTRQIMIVPIDDVSCWRFQFTTQPMSNPRGLGGPPFHSVPGFPYDPIHAKGIIERKYTAANDYMIDREAQRTVSYSGIPEFRSQDLMVTESAGPRYDRTKEHLGSTDVAIIRMHRMLLGAAKKLPDGVTPPGITGGDFRSIRAAEKILEPGEDWRILGTDDDPTVQEALAALQRGAPA